MVAPGKRPLDLRSLCLDLALNMRREHWCSIFLCYLDMVKYFIHIVGQLTKVRQACINYPKFTPPNSWRHPQLSALLILLIFRVVFVRTITAPSKEFSRLTEPNMSSYSSHVMAHRLRFEGLCSCALYLVKFNNPHRFSFCQPFLAMVFQLYYIFIWPQS